MKVELPDTYNAATTFVDENIALGRGDRTAIHYQDQKFTYQKVYEKINRTGNALKELGVEIEHRVLLSCPTRPNSLSVSLAPLRSAPFPFRRIRGWPPKIMTTC